MGPRLGLKPGGRCSEGKASVHATPALPTELNGAPHLSFDDGGSEFVLKNLVRVSSMELKAFAVEMCDEEAKILPIYEQNTRNNNRH